jgi:prephenate dehydratase
MEGVLSRVEHGEADCGIFPVVNSRGGLVQTAFEAMGRHHFYMIGELWLEVQQCLLGLPGLKKEQITHVTTHPQAISQCERYLKRELPAALLVEWDDTAKAARDLAEKKIPSTSAVIAPARAALVYGLEVIERGIQDMHPNLTTFIIVKRM